VVKTQVRAVDVLPTAAAIAGFAAPAVDGESVLPNITGSGHGTAQRDPAPSYAETFYPKWHFGWSELKSVRVGDWKYIDAPKPELYDMRADAAEKRSAIDARGPLASGLAAELGKIQTGFGGAASAEAPQPDPETLARLRSLGYVGIVSPSSTGRGPDPKDMAPKLAAYRAGISRAMDAIGRGQADTAIAELKKLAASDDRAYEVHLFLGDAYASKRQFDSALGEYEAAGVLNPHSAAPIVSAARVYLAKGDLGNATARLDTAAKIEPSSGEIALVRGSVLDRQGRTSDALAQYQAAVHANGSDAQARASVAGAAMRLQKYDVARVEFERLLQMGYRPSRMHFGLGQIAEAGGDVPKAMTEYRLAVQSEPGLQEAASALTRLSRAGKQEE